MSDRVELHPAWSWSCESCGRRNYDDAVAPESLEGQLPEGFDDGAFEGGEWITKPTQVTCSHCGAEFGVEEDGDRHGFGAWLPEE